MFLVLTIHDNLQRTILSEQLHMYLRISFKFACTFELSTEVIIKIILLITSYILEVMRMFLPCCS